MVAILEKNYTVEEYFELEKTSEIRHEFVYGKLIPMPGESKAANKIANNILRKLADPLEEKKLEIFTHDVRLRVKDRKLYRYPDLIIAPESDDVDSHNITQPVMIVEVVSKSTAREDRGKKLREYCAIPTMQYYLIVEQSNRQISMYSKENDRWVVDFFDKEEEIIKLSAFEVEISLEDIYRKIKIN